MGIKTAVPIAPLILGLAFALWLTKSSFHIKAVVIQLLTWSLLMLFGVVVGLYLGKKGK